MELAGPLAGRRALDVGCGDHAFARALAPLDPRLGRGTTLGAAFIALNARKPPQP